MSPPQLSEVVAQSTAGGKGQNLQRLVRAGFPVPAFGVLGAELLDDALMRSGAGDHIERALDGVNAETAAAVSAQIEQLVLGLELSEATNAAIAAAYADAGAGIVAVRSSAVDEDGTEHSFAGQGSSYLGVRGDDSVASHVRRCWASAWSERALTYRLLHSIALERIRTAVVVQEIVHADVSGVLFTVNPSNGAADELLVSAVYGLGETLVSGQVDADTVTLARSSGRVISASVGDKDERLDADAGGSGPPAVPRTR